MALAGSDVSHHYEESRAHDVEKPLTACNRYASIRAPIIDHIGRSGASDTEALLPAVNQILLTLATTRGLVLANAAAVALNAAENGTLTPSHSSWPTSARPRARITGTRAPTTPRRASPAEGRKPDDDTTDQAIAMALDEGGRHPMMLVFIDAVPTAGHRFRVLENRESARAMGFDDEEQGYEFQGNRGELPKRFGNDVPVSLVAALAGATPAP